MSRKVKGQEFIDDVEEDVTKYKYDTQRAKVFGDAIKAFKEEGDDKKATEMYWEFLIFELRYLNFGESKKSKERFAPLIEYKDGTVFPDFQNFSDKQIDYYLIRAKTTLNPIHKARYNDFIWEMKKDHNFARNAIEAYLECVSIFLNNKWDLETVDALQRITELSLKLNDRALINNVINKIIETSRILRNEKRVRWCLELIDCIFELKRFLEGNELRTCLDVAYSGIAFYEKKKDGYHLQRSFLDRIVKIMNALGRQDLAEIHGKNCSNI